MTSDVLHEMAGRIKECVNFGDAARKRAVAPDSTFTKEAATAFDHGVRIAYSTALMNLLACEDFMASLPRILVDPLPKFAQDVLIRAALESAARAWWLLDPLLNARQRAVRGLLHLLTSAREGREAVAVAGSEQDMETTRQKLTEVADLARQYGFEVKEKGRHFQLDGVRRPSSTQLMSDFLGPAGLLQFKDLSGVAHGHTHSLIERYRETGAGSSIDSIHLEPYIEVADVAVDLGLLCMGHLDAVQREIALHGRSDAGYFETRSRVLHFFHSLFGETEPSRGK